MATTRAVVTDEDLLRLPKDGRRYERVDGELRAMSPAGWRHEAVAVRLVCVIDPEARKAGVHRSISEAREVGGNGDLEGEDVLRGFRCPLAAIL